METTQPIVADGGAREAQPPSTTARRAVVWMPIVACLTLGLLGVYPGCVFSSSCFTPLVLAGLGLGGAIIWIRAVVRTKTSWLVALGLAAAVIGTGEAANYYLVASAAFPLFQHAFELQTARVRPGERIQDQWIGIYHIEEIAADERGGIYFVVNRSFAMMYETCRGFAFRPNTEGTPFGSGGYFLTPINDDWAVFGLNVKL